MTISLTTLSQELQKKIYSKTARVGVIGLGYVGLPTACHYSSVGYKVTGFDISTEKVDLLNRGHSYIDDIDSLELLEYVNSSLFSATTDMNELDKMDIILICVPTPINKVKEPDTSFIKSAGEKVVEFASKGTLVILESTTYPGTTEEFIVNPLIKKGFIVGESIFIAYSPERIDPGNKIYNLDNTPKVVGGYTENCLELAREFIGHTAHCVSDVRVAEMSKIYENTFRWINTALVNEFTIICKELDINIWETIEAASSKPYGFMKFTPGIGVGGHCIPVDPFYLTYKAKENGLRTKMIELAGEINDGMVQFNYHRIIDILSDNKLPKHANIVILGAAYKIDIGDLRESPVVKLIEKLQNKVKTIKIIEPYSNHVEMNGTTIPCYEYDSKIVQNSDLVVIGTPHSCFDWEKVKKDSNLIFDTKNVMYDNGILSEKIVVM